MGNPFGFHLWRFKQKITENVARNIFASMAKKEGGCFEKKYSFPISNRNMML